MEKKERKLYHPLMIMLRNEARGNKQSKVLPLDKYIEGLTIITNPKNFLAKYRKRRWRRVNRLEGNINTITLQYTKELMAYVRNFKRKGKRSRKQ